MRFQWLMDEESIIHAVEENCSSPDFLPSDHLFNITMFLLH